MGIDTGLISVDQEMTFDGTQVPLEDDGEVWVQLWFYCHDPRVI